MNIQMDAHQFTFRHCSAATQCVCSVQSIRLSDMNLFTEYLLPNLDPFRKDDQVRGVLGLCTLALLPAMSELIPITPGFRCM